MAALKKEILKNTLLAVHIVRVDRATAKRWNSRKRADEVRVFCGWYWLRGNDEAGPFSTYSACVRDAYIRFVQQRELPLIGHFAAGKRGNVMPMQSPKRRRM